jgi:hypothetical protein
MSIYAMSIGINYRQRFVAGSCVDNDMNTLASLDYVLLQTPPLPHVHIVHCTQYSIPNLSTTYELRLFSL